MHPMQREHKSEDVGALESGVRRFAMKLSREVLAAVAEYAGTEEQRAHLCRLLQLCARNRILPATSDGNTAMHVAALNVCTRGVVCDVAVGRCCGLSRCRLMVCARWRWC
jgi:hypothetical protein